MFTVSFVDLGDYYVHAKFRNKEECFDFLADENINDKTVIHLKTALFTVKIQYLKLKGAARETNSNGTFGSQEI